MKCGASLDSSWAILNCCAVVLSENIRRNRSEIPAAELKLKCESVTCSTQYISALILCSSEEKNGAFADAAVTSDKQPASALPL